MSTRRQIRTMFARPTTGKTRRRLCLEVLEGRRLLTVGYGAPPSGAFTPFMIQNAYGIDKLLLAGNQGQGQTVAVVSAYDWPTATADLTTFCAQFDLPVLDGSSGRPSFTKVNQSGNTSPLPSTDTPGFGSWGHESAQDVEWIHAIAPRANIVLVEADFSSPTLLYSAAATAASLPGVSVVSMSWGNIEFPEDSAYDHNFQTPAGHNGVTFVASSGDGGAGSHYPAGSANVVAVGGTSLTTDSNGTYASESGWSGSGGWTSFYTPKPSYQSSLPYTNRTIPDVSFVADPLTPAAVADSYDFGAATPWQYGGGTSLAAPCWAGLIATADQMRADHGLKTLDGPSQTLPLLYGIYNDPVKYAADFHDITTGNNTPPFDGANGYDAGPGYDLVTGIGSPIANHLVNDLLLDVSATSTSVGSSAGQSVFSQSVTFTATVANAPGAAAPTGTVSFYDGTTLLGTAPLSGGSATLATSALAVGSHSITARYGGDTKDYASTSSPVGQVVNLAPTTTSVSLPANPPAFGEFVTLTATVSANAPAAGVPRGGVSFYDGTTLLGTAPLTGSPARATLATSALAVGSHSIAARYSGDSGFYGSATASVVPVSATGIHQPRGVAADAAGDVFIADYGQLGNDGQVLKVTPDGTQTTIASGLYVILGVAADAAGDVFISDGNNYGNSQILEVKRDGSQAVLGFSGLAGPTGVAVDAAGDAFVAGAFDGALELNKDGSQTTFGSGLNKPYGVAVDGAGDAFISDTGNNRVVKVTLGGTQTTVASGLRGPTAIAADAAGDVFIVDTDIYANGRVLEVTPSGTQAIVATGLFLPSGEAVGMAVDGAGDVFVASRFLGVVEVKLSGVPLTVDRAPTSVSVGASSSAPNVGQTETFTATVASPSGTPTPTGTVGFYDGTTLLGTASLTGSPTRATWTTTSLAGGPHTITARYSGNGLLAPSVSGVEPTSAQVVVAASGLLVPAGVAVDGSGDVFIADTDNNRVVKVTPDGTRTTVASGLNFPAGVAVDGSGDVFIADYANSRVVQVKPDGTQATVGSGLSGPLGVAVDGSGDVFIADTGNNRVVQVTPDGTQTTVASGLNQPHGVAPDGAGDVFISDTGNNRVVKVTADGTRTTVASGLNQPWGVAIDGAGDLFIADSHNNRVVQVTPDGTRTTVGSGLNSPFGVAVDGAGDLFIADSHNSRVVQLTVGVPVTVNRAPTAIALSNARVAENQPSGTTVGTFSTTDPDSPDTFTYSLVVGAGDTDDALFSISGSTLKTAASFDFEAKSSYSIRVRSTDAGGLFVEKVFTIGIINVNEPPSVAGKLGAVTTNEGSPAGNTGTFADPEGNGTVTLTASVGTIIQQNTTGTWSWSYTPPDGPDGPTTVTITATDDGNLTSTTSFALMVYNVAPTVAITGVPASGHSPEGTAIALGSAVTDPSPVDTSAGFTYAWTVTKGGSAFASGAASGFHFTPDDNGTYVVSLTATDKDGAPSPTAIATITVDDVAPTAAITGVPASGHSPEGTAIALGSAVSDPSPVDQSAGFGYAWSATKNGVAYASGSSAGFGFTPDDNGTYVVSLIAIDKDGVTGPAAQTTILVDDVAPTVAITGAPASGHGLEGTLITLGSTVTDPSPADAAAGFTYAWTVTKDGSAYASGSSVGFGFTPDDNGTYVVSLTATDKDRAASPAASATITVDNVVPTAAVTGPSDGVRGQARTFTLTAADPSAVDRAAGFTFAIIWGDGATQTVAGPSGTAVSHVFTASGAYVVQVTATDKDGGTGAAATQSDTITAVALETDPVDPTTTALFVGGTTAADTITLKPADASGTLDVMIGTTNLGNFQPTGRVVVYGQAGDDTIKIQSASIPGSGPVSVSAPAYLFGGDGNDTLNTAGSIANNVLVGGAGDDTLQAGTGRDLLIGGLGADVLHGDGGDDLLIGGTTDFDNNLIALDSVMAEWGRTDADYTTRVNHLKGTLGGGRNGATFLSTVTVHDDAAIDTLFGQGGLDWFFAELSGPYKDTIKSQSAGEVITGL